MSKVKFICTNCQFEFSKWEGKCSKCLQWNTIEEKMSFLSSSKKSEIKFNKISEIEITDELVESTSIDEFDRVLGGGFTKGSITLLGGDPGVGKSTLLLEVIDKYSSKHSKNVLYISGEETESQIAKRAKRIGVINERIFICTNKNLSESITLIDQINPGLVIIDSVQTMQLENSNYNSGSVSLIKEIASELIDKLKPKDISCILIGHITKDGSIAGPKHLEHMVDTSLYLEKTSKINLRKLKSLKNRYGDTSEVGYFNLKKDGIIEVVNPIILRSKRTENFGTANFLIKEGVRCNIGEIEALVHDSTMNIAKRNVQNIDINRLNMLLAVVNKYVDNTINYEDVYISSDTKLRKDERYSDLGIVASILSSKYKKQIKNETLLWGEIKLSGELIAPELEESHLRQLENLGIKKVITAKNAIKTSSKIQINEISNIDKLKSILDRAY